MPFSVTLVNSAKFAGILVIYLLVVSNYPAGTVASDVYREQSTQSHRNRFSRWDFS